MSEEAENGWRCGQVEEAAAVEWRSPQPQINPSAACLASWEALQQARSEGECVRLANSHLSSSSSFHSTVHTPLTNSHIHHIAAAHEKPGLLKNARLAIRNQCKSFRCNANQKWCRLSTE
jgi:hypothetical protein